MKPDKFIEAYETALASQNWLNVAPLIAENATVTFSNGQTHIGTSEIRIAFEKNFAAIKNEKYKITNINWLLKNDSVGVYTFHFEWKGSIKGVDAQGAGIGTSVLINDGGQWKLLTEHLGTLPKK